MNPHSRRLDFAGRSINIRYACERAGQLLDFLFNDLWDTSLGNNQLNKVRDPHVSLDINSDPITGALSYCDLAQVTVSSIGTCDGDVANHLLGDVTYHLADRCDQGMVFHAGSVRYAERCIVLPGQSGAGKTSCTAWLTHRGCDYLTDELIYVQVNDETGEHELYALTRPFNFKTPVLQTIHVQLGTNIDSYPNYRCDFATLIPHRQINAQYHGNHGLPSYVVFPEYVAGSRGALTHLSSAKTALGLMACLVNGRNLDEHGFRAVSHMARNVQGFSLRYGHFDQIDAMLAESDIVVPVSSPPVFSSTEDTPSSTCS